MASLDVSVVLPVHGSAPYLNAAIASILQEDNGLLELIVIDDRLDDDGHAALAGIADDRLRIVRCEGAGLVAALNTGLAAARGTYVARMDADDVSVPGRLAMQRRYLLEHSETVVVGGQLIVIDEHGNEVGARRYPLERRAIRRMLRHRNVLAHPAVMFRRDTALRAGGYRTEFRGAEDYDLWLRMAESGDLANLPEVVLRYRVHGGQVTAAASVVVAESTYLAQWSAKQRAHGSPNLPLPWLPGGQGTELSVAVRARRWRVVTAASQFVRVRTALARRRYDLAVIAGLIWMPLRPRYTVVQAVQIGGWLRVALRPRDSKQ